MKYILLNAEQVSENEANLYVKKYQEIWSPIEILKITINSPKIVFSYDTEYPLLFKNLFYRNFPYEMKCMRTFDDCEDADFVITEFSSPIEQLVIEKKIKGLSIIEYDGNYNNLKNLGPTKLPNLKVAAVYIKEFKFEYFDCNQIIEGELRDLNAVIKKEDCDVVVLYNTNSKKLVSLKKRIICDIYSLAQSSIKCRDYSIEELCSYFNLELTSNAKAIYDIFYKLNSLELAMEFSEISGIFLNNCLKNARAERIEYLLLHTLYNGQYLFPPAKQSFSHSYTGGLVLEPLKGVYTDYVMLLDFNSLYPSIIQEYNLCFSDKSKILPNILKNLVERRRAVKKLIKENNDQSLKIREKALKLTANSIYGCLGSTISRFSNVEIASAITAKGREILSKAKCIAENMGLKVIYGDTDSIMIDSCSRNIEEVKSKANKLAKEINSQYKVLTIELESVYKKVLLFAKKKYGAIDLKNNIFEKGLDSVRRNFCLLSTELYASLLKIILNNENFDEVIYEKLLEFKNNFYNFKIEKFIISNQLSKSLDLYSQACPSHHIALARRLNTYEVGDIINYVIGEGGVFHPSEKFKIDYDYYLNNQVLPPIYRLLSILNFNIDKVNLIFDIKKFTRVSTAYLSLITECCMHTQRFALINCEKCSQPVLNQIFEVIKKEISDIYAYKCSICNDVTDYDSCCNTKIKIDNSKFDRIITELTRADDAVLNNLGYLYSKHSAYRRIPLSKYFNVIPEKD